METLELPTLPEHIQALLTPKYRLVINKIEINNFKSFAGRIQLDQFDEVNRRFDIGLLNLSDSSLLAFYVYHRAERQWSVMGELIFVEKYFCLGKSNVIDSLLFVIGHRASKMRGAKLSTLLHNSAECPNVKSCSVTVHFEAIAIEGVRDRIRNAYRHWSSVD